MDCARLVRVSDKGGEMSEYVTLRDGRGVSSNSEAWRLECEARTILKRRDRKEYLEKVRQKRGVDAAVELRNEMLAIKGSKNG